jgi:RNA polymerase sigma-70 factor (ECF subfamily)
MVTQKLDRKSLEPLLIELRPRLHRYCARMTGSVIDGEDVLQDAVIKALSAADASPSVEKPEQWLFRIAHNAAHDHLRRRARERARLSETDMTTIEDPSEQADRRYIAQASLRTFMHLTVPQRSAVILVDVLGLSLHEACEVTGSTLAGTKAALHRGRAQLEELARQPDLTDPPKLDAAEERKLRRYVDFFNARDFDAVRALIAEDIQLEVVNRTRMRGKAQVSTYYGNYSRVDDWALSLGFVDGKAAILIRNPEQPEAGVRGFMLIEWMGDEVSHIRDFRYASYCVEGADIREL